jgi:uncharacterized protein (DUF2461 family)
MTPEFNGFPEEGLRFLRQLKLHNDRDWFRERKDSYTEFVEEPMRALVQAVAAGCRAKRPAAPREREESGDARLPRYPVQQE